MLKRLFIVAVAGIALAACFAGEAAAQRRDDDRFFFLRDPFGRGGLFDFPDRPPAPVQSPWSPPQQQRKTYVEPPSDEPVGTIYSSSTEADQQRFIGASEYVVVMGDSIAEQLAQGLADEFVTERPEVAIIKKARSNSGLIRTDVYDWTAQASSLLAKEKATAIVVELGINDRQPIRDDKETYEFRSDRWRELYGKRVEEFLNKLKEKNVPIFVVGLPPVRSPKMSLDNVYLNEIISERTRKVGGYYIDVWDGFVSENGDFIATGAALDGQTRRLRLNDGVHFTKAGQRKLAHYAERELVRLFDSRPGKAAPKIPDAAPEASKAAPEGQTPNARPLAGPVLPLTQFSGSGGSELAGASNARSSTKVSLPASDPNLARMLIDGRPLDAQPGRADDFRWPRPKESAEAVPAAPASTAAPAADAAQDAAPAPLRPVMEEPKAQKKAPQ